VRLAQGALVAIGDPKCGGELGEWAQEVRERVGAERVTIDPTIAVVINALPPSLQDDGGKGVKGRIIDTHMGRGFAGRRKGATS
jgi:hypothetical protein